MHEMLLLSFFSVPLRTMCPEVKGYKNQRCATPQASEIPLRVFPLIPNSRSMKFTLNIVALPLLPLLLASMGLTAPMRSDETIREMAFPDRAFPDRAFSDRDAAPAAILCRFLFLRVGLVV